MRQFFTNKVVAFISRTVTVLFFVGLILWAARVGISFFWPAYDYDLSLASPEGHYELVVIRGDAAAFADFSYHIYVFPREIAPKQTPKGQQFFMRGIWRDQRYLVYSGFSYPVFRWKNENSIEIVLSEKFVELDEFHPVKKFSEGRNVLTSLIFGEQKDVRYSLP